MNCASASGTIIACAGAEARAALVSVIAPHRQAGAPGLSRRGSSLHQDRRFHTRTLHPLRVMWQVLLVLGSVAVTSIAGLVFCWLRLRSKSLNAPVMAHA